MSQGKKDHVKENSKCKATGGHELGVFEVQTEV
jgi:hypothetical protein